MSDSRHARLRALPSVDRLATAVARAELAARRQQILDGGDSASGEVDLVARARSRLRAGARPVLNATGVILHTNLGRAPLSAEARSAIAAAAAGYSALELDLTTGKRTRRGRLAEQLLIALTGSEAALVVNNGAAAVLLATAALAGRGREVVVSRGELVEIGGGLRIADVVAQSGATLVEVGSTNRTRTEDYEEAIGARTGAILRVHQSNFQMTGFVERPGLQELVGLGVPVIDDIGSGALDPDRSGFGGEPTAGGSIAAGATLTCFSGDKLLGAPQAGIVLGGSEAVRACREHPLARALRIDKLCLAGLEATLELHFDSELASRRIPTLAMLDLDPAELMARTERLALLSGGTVTEMPSPAGGGALPLHELHGPAVEIDPGDQGAEALAALLRSGDPPLMTRIHSDRVLLSARTLALEEIAIAGDCVTRARQS